MEQTITVVCTLVSPPRHPTFIIRIDPARSVYDLKKLIVAELGDPNAKAIDLVLVRATTLNAIPGTAAVKGVDPLALDQLLQSLRMDEFGDARQWELKPETVSEFQSLLGAHLLKPVDQTTVSLKVMRSTTIVGRYGSFPYEDDNIRDLNHILVFYISSILPASDAPSSSRAPFPSKVVVCNGPLVSNKNLMIPIDSLAWGRQLMMLVDGGNSVLLHGHWQTGKTSSLIFLQERAIATQKRVIRIDMLTESNSLRLHSKGLYNFLASKFFPAEKDSFPEFDCSQFCKFIQDRFGEGRLLLLVDEYDSFLTICVDKKEYLMDMNTLISHSQNLQNIFSCIVCVGSFSIVVRQISPDVSDLMEVESEDSLDAIVRPFNVDSPWNKTTLVETTPFAKDVFSQFCNEVYVSHGLSVQQGVVNDIWETTRGHPGFSMWLVVTSIAEGFNRGRILCVTDWMTAKQEKYLRDLRETPTMQKILQTAQASKTAKSALHRLVRDNEVHCEERISSFFRAVGVGYRPDNHDGIYFSSPIIRDALLQQFYPSCDNVTAFVDIPKSPPSNFLESLLIKVLPYIKAEEILDPLAVIKKGLGEAAVHAETYQILHSLLRQADVRILTETRVVKDSKMRCDLWLKNSLMARGIEFKTELTVQQVLEASNDQLIQYASSEPQEMLIVNFVRKEAESIEFPINIKPTNWPSNTKFSVLFVHVQGDIKSGLCFRIARNGDAGWVNE
ncbi:hypothetical protein HDU79_011897 [Rhizoclosmatium sp. JEL0117]|nr:hypothetical protein HDU79_011897 [Rhizoclosmatium sp. JEL0117]